MSEQVGNVGRAGGTSRTLLVFLAGLAVMFGGGAAIGAAFGPDGPSGPDQHDHGSESVVPTAEEPVPATTAGGGGGGGGGHDGH